MKSKVPTLSFVILALAFVLIAGTVRADGVDTVYVSGTLASTQVTGPDCHSPIGLCTAGTLTGTLAGSFFYSADTLTTLPDGVTGIFDGTFVVQTASGVITAHDHTTANLVTGALVDTQTVLGGTNRWAGATGTINVVGAFNFATGVGASTYSGTVSVPQNR